MYAVNLLLRCEIRASAPGSGYLGVPCSPSHIQAIEQLQNHYLLRPVPLLEIVKTAENDERLLCGGICLKAITKDNDCWQSTGVGKRESRIEDHDNRAV